MLDLVVLHIEEFDIILNMSWLSPYYAILDCYAKTVVVAMCKMENLVQRYF